MSKTSEQKAPADTGTDLAVKTEGAVGAYGADAGLGFENKTTDFVKVPFLRVLQGQSPLVLAGAPGAKAGEILNTGTDEIYPKGTPTFIAVYVERRYIEWIPKADGQEGGFVASHDPSSDLVRKAVNAAGGKYKPAKAPNGNDLVETFSVYGILCVKGMQPRPAIVAFASTGISHFQKWYGKADIQMGDGSPEFPECKPSYPLFAFEYVLNTVMEKNAKGTFFNFDVVPAGGAFKTSLVPYGGPIYKAAKALYNDVVGGKVEVDHNAGLGGNDRAGQAGAGGGTAGDPNEEIPF